MKKSMSAGKIPAGGVVVRVPARKIAAAAPPRGRDYSRKIASPEEGGQALVQSVNALRKKLIRELS
jgi:hypothetical protein